MRVIAGVWRGRRLVSPSGTVARPTTDRVKESMFNLLLGRWQTGVVVDLFAGSGALGIEALSRGASRAYFIDADGHSVRAIKANLAAVQTSDKDVWRMDWKQALARIAACERAVHIVFVDPPYQQAIWLPVLRALSASPLAVTGGVVCEHPARVPLPEVVDRFRIWKTRTYGDITVTIYTQDADAADTPQEQE